MSKNNSSPQNAINIIAIQAVNTTAIGKYERVNSENKAFSESSQAVQQNLPQSGQQSGQQSVQLRAQLQLREMILAGELPAGARIAELSIVEKLGFSRTPIRAALVKLEQEGLLDALPNGGYAVKTFSERDVAEAIELRGTLEGLSARLAAERGAAPVVLNEARQCLQAIDAVLGEPALDDEAFASYVKLNEQFHALLSELSGSSVIAKELERVCSLPFASPSGFVVVQANSPKARDMLVVAQDQHWQVMDAIDRREGSRAESLMREHSRIAQRNLRDVVQNQTLNQLPGVSLIRKRN
jgi:GntR family transcriptional regulator, vanillate catabolism transcriptional regulator